MKTADLLLKCQELAEDGILGETTYDHITEAFMSIKDYPLQDSKFNVVVSELIEEIEQEREISDSVSGEMDAILTKLSLKQGGTI